MYTLTISCLIATALTILIIMVTVYQRAGLKTYRAGSPNKNEEIKDLVKNGYSNPILSEIGHLIHKHELFLEKKEFLRYIALLIMYVQFSLSVVLTVVLLLGVTIPYSSLVTLAVVFLSLMIGFAQQVHLFKNAKEENNIHQLFSERFLLFLFYNDCTIHDKLVKEGVSFKNFDSLSIFVEYSSLFLEFTRFLETLTEKEFRKVEGKANIFFEEVDSEKTREYLKDMILDSLGMNRSNYHNFDYYSFKNYDFNTSVFKLPDWVSVQTQD